MLVKYAGHLALAVIVVVAAEVNHLPHRLRNIVRQLYELGDLAWKLDEHQERYIYNHVRDWQKRRHKDKGANRIFMIDAARQTGKSHTCSIIELEDGFRTPGGRFMYASATEIALKEFIIPNIESILSDCPEDLCPVFKQRYKGMRAHFRWPKTNAQLKLVGIDEDPKGLRGPGLHGGTIGEAGFVVKLKATIGGELYPQMQRYPDSTLILESSAPKDLDHDFDTVFKPSCEQRKAYVFLTIDDNTAISEATKKEFVDAAKEIDPVDAEREYYGKRVRSKQLTVFPEFDRETHVLKTFDLPRHGLALASYDPGQKHLFGLTWSVYDFRTARIVFVDDWCEHNASTEKVAAITAAREHDLFGTTPSAKLARLSVQEWADLLADDRTANSAHVLHNLANERAEIVKKNRPTKHTEWAFQGRSEWQWFDNDAQEWRPNPHLRVSDVNPQLINDMSTMFGLYLDPTTKDDLREVMVQLVRSMLKQKRVFFGPLAHNTALHMNACTWHKNRTEWIEHSIYSHFDLAATVMYGLRYWMSFLHIDPYPPKHFGKRGEDWVGQMQVIEQPIEYGDHW